MTQLQARDLEATTEAISDAYINIAVGKEKLKLFKEANINYFNALT
jgi:hypothetical protein